MEQIEGPVRWEETKKALKELGCRYAIELGPGKVLSGLIRRIDRQIKNLNLEQPGELEGVLAEFGS